MTPIRTLKQAGAAIRRQRRLLKLSQVELARRLGMSQETISLTERGQTAVRLDNLLAILGELGLELGTQSRSASYTHDLDDLLG